MGKYIKDALKHFNVAGSSAPVPGTHKGTYRSCPTSSSKGQARDHEKQN